MEKDIDMPIVVKKEQSAEFSQFDFSPTNYNNKFPERHVRLVTISEHRAKG